MEERGWGAQLQLSRYSSLEGEAITLTFPNLKFYLFVILRLLSVLEEGSHDPKVLAMLD